MKVPYKALLFSPFLLYVLGITANAVVTLTNGQHMPVLPPGGNCLLLQDGDILHVCMTQATHFKWLADVFVSNDGVASLGDLLQDLGDMLAKPMFIAWLVLVVRDAFRRGT